MGSLERLSLRWNEYESNFKQGFSDLRQNEELFDVTIISGSKIMKAHKVILSACSPVFRSIIGSAPVQAYPLIYLRGINSYYLELLLSFMYYGEVSVDKEELDDFIAIAQEFQIKGLSNYSMPRKRCESQPSTSNISTDLTPYPPQISQDLSIVRDDINDSFDKTWPKMENEENNRLDENNTLKFTQNAYEGMETYNDSKSPDIPIVRDDLNNSLSKSLPKTENEVCNILHESDALEFTQNASEKLETNNDSDSCDISIVRDDINNSLSKSLPNTENEECYTLDESNTLEFTQNGSEQMETNEDDVLECISLEQNQDYDKALNREIIQHYSNQKNGIGYQCKKCNYKSEIRLRMHYHVEAKHIVTRGYICSICKKKYKTRRSLYLHKYRVHKGESVVFEGPKVIR
ncbi:uncharacterized protein [Lepeophtheirus salmonis]|uniref:uncharacterized protein n=1 Tax=Lepeophtheirus salmonis TaxID=72036 RepID=UPI001AE5BF74|nr:protein abrupt-like [Lepeophtheirus salmonis]